MRNWTALRVAAAAMSGLGVLAPAAEAQSLLQKIFGFGGSPRQGVAPSYRVVIPPHRFPSYGATRTLRPQVQQNDSDDIGPPDSTGPYKTVCVRTCDGFYFPLRHNAVHENFASDVNTCRSACGTDARLFYYPLNGPEGPDAMVDLTGRKYADLPHAFAYRKSLVRGCACKPAPWSAEEAARHQSYADQEAIELAKDEAFLKERARQDANARQIESEFPADTASAGISAENASEPVAVRPQLRRSRMIVQRAYFRPASSPSWFGARR